MMKLICTIKYIFISYFVSALRKETCLEHVPQFLFALLSFYNKHYR